MFPQTLSLNQCSCESLYIINPATFFKAGEGGGGVREDWYIQNVFCINNVYVLCEQCLHVHVLCEHFRALCMREHRLCLCSTCELHRFRLCKSRITHLKTNSTVS